LFAALALLTTVCNTTATSSPTASASPVVGATAIPKSSETPAPTASAPTAAAGGIEVWASGALGGTIAWVVREEFASEDRVTESLYAVPIDGSPPKMVVRRSRAKQAISIIPFRQLSVDGTALALEQSSGGPAAHDGFIVVDLAKGSIRELARGDQRVDVMPAWSPDGRRIAYARRDPGTTSVPRDDGLWIINADGTGPVRVLPPATGTHVTNVFGWTADGGAIAFGLAVDGVVSYSTVDIGTGTTSSPHGIAYGLAPASWRLKTPQFAGAFGEGVRGADQRIKVADGAGRSSRAIVSDQLDLAAGDPILQSARWSPISDEILYIRSARQGKIYRVQASGGPPTEVPISGQPFRAEWLPDGRIAFITVAQGIGAELQIIDGTRQAVLFSFRPGGASFTDFAIRSHTP
jgi:dipeptidyl aminopeptidase/acylaminoacyl peptidase